jgi:cytochrome c-type biogenesis protein CcmE
MIKIIATITAVLAGGGFLVYSSMADAQPYKMVDDLVAKPAGYENRTMRLHGYVEPGSIETNIVAQQTERTFVLENNGKRIQVKHIGPAPDTFRDESEVVAKGKLSKEGDVYVFHASELMAKCPSKYEGVPKASENQDNRLFNNN